MPGVRPTPSPSWVGDKDVRVTRVYALAFTPDGEMLLVGGGPGDPGYWLPGGGIEDGETPETELIRELFEEAAATVHKAERLGAQRVDDPTSRSEYHAFYWCRVMLADKFIPKHEVAERKMVAPQDFRYTVLGTRRPEGCHAAGAGAPIGASVRSVSQPLSFWGGSALMR